jgi:hypothetical protein
VTSNNAVETEFTLQGSLVSKNLMSHYNSLKGQRPIKEALSEKLWGDLLSCKKVG